MSGADGMTDVIQDNNEYTEENGDKIKIAL